MSFWIMRQYTRLKRIETYVLQCLSEKAPNLPDFYQSLKGALAISLNPIRSFQYEPERAGHRTFMQLP